MRTSADSVFNVMGSAHDRERAELCSAQALPGWGSMVLCEAAMKLHHFLSASRKHGFAIPGVELIQRLLILYSVYDKFF